LDHREDGLSFGQLASINPAELLSTMEVGRGGQLNSLQIGERHDKSKSKINRNCKGYISEMFKEKVDLHFCPAISGKVLPMAVATPQDFSIHLSVHPWMDSSSD
jgi:hypothetical protein